MPQPCGTSDERKRTEFLGHPRALGFLFATEMWERFSYYGMRALLVLYMTNHLLGTPRAGTVLGLEGLKGALESVSGPLGPQPFASQIYGLYTGFVYFTPILGGLVADRLLGQRRTVIVGAVLMAAGHFMMAFEPLFLLALLTLVVGNGAFKPNISTQVGGLYAPADPRRDRAYSIFYVGVNLGAFLAPLVCGTLGEAAGWHYGFAAAGVGMTLGLGIYLYALRALPPDIRTGAAADLGQPGAGEGARATTVLLALFLPMTLFWAAYEQSGNTVALWADGFADRSVNLFFWRGNIPVTWFQALNPLMIFAFTPLVLAVWRQQEKRGTEPSTIGKMAYGCLGVAAASLILAAASWNGAGSKASAAWLLLYFVVLTLGELYVSPVGLSLVSKVAPLRMVSLMMGLWLATSFTGNLLAGFIGSLWSGMEKPTFFALVAAIAALAGAGLWVSGRKLEGVAERNIIT